MMGPRRSPQKHDFSLELTRVIEPKGGPGVELEALRIGICAPHPVSEILDAILEQRRVLHSDQPRVLQSA